MPALLRFFAAIALAVGVGGCATGRVMISQTLTASDALDLSGECQVKAQQLCTAGFQVVSGGPHYWLIRCPQYNYYPSY